MAVRYDGEIFPQGLRRGGFEPDRGRMKREKSVYSGFVGKEGLIWVETF
jgi:hypothetical protein